MGIFHLCNDKESTNRLWLPSIARMSSERESLPATSQLVPTDDALKAALEQLVQPPSCFPLC